MQRPGGVTLIAVLDFIGAGFCVIAALLFFAGGSALSSMFAAAGATGGGILGAGVAIAGGVFLLFGILAAATGYGMIKLMNWARILSIIFAALGILSGANNLIRYNSLMTTGSMVWAVVFLLFDVWVIWYLLQAKVSQAFTQKTA
jgi:hypothetical protein